mgnify:CR=1 FL=1
MPRAGGEYVYISRIINPALGFVAGLAITLTYVMITSMFAAWMAIGSTPLIGCTVPSSESSPTAAQPSSASGGITPMAAITASAIGRS